jgi:hypothetical protein
MLPPALVDEQEPGSESKEEDKEKLAAQAMEKHLAQLRISDKERSIKDLVHRAFWFCVFCMNLDTFIEGRVKCGS